MRSTTSAGATCRSGSSIPDSRWSGGFDKEIAGSGALGDLGAHVIDLARFLVGEVSAVSGTDTDLHLRIDPVDRVDVDDAFEAVVEFECGAIGTIEASRFCHGRKNAFTWEINGSKARSPSTSSGSTSSQVYLVGSTTGRPRPGVPSGARQRGRPPVLGALVASRPHHRLGAHVRARDPPSARGDRRRHDVRPYGADFEDGYRAAEVCDAVVRSSSSGRREPLQYRAA